MPALEKELDKPGAADVEQPAPAAPGDGGAWVESALECATELQAAIPVDAPKPVLPLFRELIAKLIEAGGGVEYATTPGDNPPTEFKAPKKAAVANTVAARPGWKASAITRSKPLLEAIPVEATACLEAYNALKKAISSAKPGDRTVEE